MTRSRVLSKFSYFIKLTYLTFSPVNFIRLINCGRVWGLRWDKDWLFHYRTSEVCSSSKRVVYPLRGNCRTLRSVPLHRDSLGSTRVRECRTFVLYVVTFTGYVDPENSEVERERRSRLPIYWNTTHFCKVWGTFFTLIPPYPSSSLLQTYSKKE